MKLENKLIFILLIMGVLSAAVVGGVAYYMLLKDFNQRFKDEAYGNFAKDIEMYIQEYGGWENAINSEEFHSFTQRMVASGKKTPPPHAQNAIQREKVPPMRFVVLSEHGEILRGTEDIERGSKASSEIVQKAEPIYLDGEVEVLISPVGELILSESHRSYLSAMRDSLLYGFLIAALFAVAIGLAVGKKIGSSIKSVIEAIKQMSQDHTKTIKIDSERKDEIGELANAFNAMNSELSIAYKKLKELSIKDPLTKLYNRRHFDEQASTLFKEAKHGGRNMVLPKPKIG